MTQSHDWLTRGMKRIPGGVNSPVRAFNGVGGEPPFIHRAKGSRIYDIDGRDYIDYVGSWGPMILGHNDDTVRNAVLDTAQHGLSFGAPTTLEVELAELVCDLAPGIDKVRMVNSGTEATMSAIRLARAASGRDKILKFEGCYHGHGDSFLVKAGSGALTLGIPNSPGVPAALADLTLTATFNDLEEVTQIVEQHASELGTIIVEPVAGNMNMIRPQPGFLAGLRALADRHDIVLIFDEVMTGFRVACGGAQQAFDVQADLVTYGKVIGGGMPVGAFGGKAELMDMVAPVGPVYQAGTLSGNPVAMAAGLATLKQLKQAQFYDELTEKTQRLCSGIQQAASKAGKSVCTDAVGGMFGIYFSEQPPQNFADVTGSDIDMFRSFFHAMLDRGIYLAPSAYEAGFVSAAHDDDDIDATIEAAHLAFAEI